jgi:hypothetical protein
MGEMYNVMVREIIVCPEGVNKGARIEGSAGPNPVLIYFQGELLIRC